MLASIDLRRPNASRSGTAYSDAQSANAARREKAGERRRNTAGARDCAASGKLISRSCRGHLQVGTADPSRCSPKGERYTKTVCDHAGRCRFLFAQTSPTIPATIRIPPRTAQRVCPLMGLPSMTFIPCRIQMLPSNTRTTLTMFTQILIVPPFFLIRKPPLARRTLGL